MSHHQWHALGREETLKLLHASREGLTNREAEQRLKIHGRNQLKTRRQFTVLKILVAQVRSFFALFLLAAALISFLLGDVTDSYIILGAVVFMVAFGFFQELKANQTLESLKKHVARMAVVIREKEEKHISVKELVPGDIVRISSGSRVPADIRLLEARNIQVDEATLTGESEPKSKKCEKISKEALLSERANMLYQGTLIVRGEGLGVVAATGNDTELGKISTLLEDEKRELTPLQKKINHLSQWVAVFILSLVTLLFVAGFLTGRDPTEMFVVSVAVAVSAIPEGLIIAITIILAIGMMRLLKRNALVRRLSSAETLGATTVICSDKTGTLTRGEMTVDEIYVLGGEKAKKYMTDIAFYAVSAHIANPQAPESDWRYEGSPTEAALFQYAMRGQKPQHYLTREKNELDHLPFEEANRFQLSLVKGEKKNRLLILGAPEVVLGYCDRHLGLSGKLELTNHARHSLEEQFQVLSKAGFRVLAGAIASLPVEINQIDQARLPAFTFIGFYALRDPLREGVREAIIEAAQAGVRTVMITGDHMLTARSIAKDLGLHIAKDSIMDATKLDKIPVGELRRLVPHISVFARVAPADKVRIVEAFKLNGNVVAMTGDGVNDAPALKRADIGVAMGTGQDVSKEAADLVLLDNNFNTIIEAIRQGRAIFDNIQKVITYLLADSFTEVILVGVSILLGLPLPLTAAQILWVNLIADGPPNVALAFEKEEADVMKRKPQLLAKAPLLTAEMKFIIFAIGIITDVILFVLFYLLWIGTGDIGYTQTMIFIGLAIDSLIYVFSIRSLRQPLWRLNPFSNKGLLYAVGISFAMLFLAIYVPFLQNVLGTIPLGALDWTLLIILAIIKLIGIEAAKWWNYQRKA